MDDHAVRLLEFNRVREELAGLCVSPQGAVRLRGEAFHTDSARLAGALELACAMRAVLESGLPLPGFDFPDIGELLPVLATGGAQLEGEELAAVGRHILSALKLKRHLLRLVQSPSLRGLVSAIPDLAPVSRKIFQYLDPEGTLKEKRIPELAAIRDRIRRLREEVERTARGLLDDESTRGYWQTNLPTQRDGRLVLPLKAQARGRVRGIVHELSASGNTLFIEPLEIVEKNNAIVQEENAYRMEVRRILRGLTADVSARCAELSGCVEAVAAADVLLARARYAASKRCYPAEPSPGPVALRDARHPLLGPGCVPITISTGGDSRIIIITGPNTGGKTVSLKTVGILSLMNQFGMEIPAGEGSQLPCFDAVFADIGDEQSIEQSLSTFSAHVTNLARIVDGATTRSLVLLDELGAGTDPEEGGALAMALLDHFLQAGPLVLSTTHHGILKNYGYTRPGVQNASMGFDGATLAPTYRILLGVPGESHALEIARRCGLPPTILDNAGAYLSDERTEITHLVQNLSERHRKLSQAEDEQRVQESDLREKRRRTDLKELALRQKELELRRQGLRELREFLAKARKEWEAMRAAGAAGTAEEAAGRLVKETQQRVEQEEGRVREESENLAGGQDLDVKEGMEVLVRGTGRRGRVLRRDRGKRWVVETETLRLSLLPSEMRPAAPAEPEPPGLSVSYAAAETTQPPVFELHLRGLRLDEAMRRLEKQIDSALLHGLREFHVIHGKGEGILRKAIHEYLAASPLVEDYHFSSPEEGGFGNTRVVLRG
jgi:DNA mismatch repair protein MutS2